MKYRVRNENGNYAYRKSIEAGVKVVHPKGSIIEVQVHNRWRPIGLIYGGKFYDSVKYIDAWNLFKCWHGSMSQPTKFDFAKIVEAGEIEFPYKHCGLDNLLDWAKKTNAIRPGDRWDDDYHNGIYHYVVTDYGRELAGIIRELFLGDNDG